MVVTKLKAKRGIIILFVIISFMLCFSTIKSDIHSQGVYDIDNRDELPPRIRISILEVLHPKFTIDEDNVDTLDKIISGDTDVLSTISYEDYVDLLDLMGEYRYYLLKNFTPNNTLGLTHRKEITLYTIFKASYENAFVSFAYALYNPDEEVVINAYIHFKKLSALINPDSRFVTPLEKVFYGNIDHITNKRIKSLHLKAILIFQRLKFLLNLQHNPDLLAKIGKNQFRLIYARIDEGIDTPPFFKLGENDIDFLLHGLDNPYLSIVYACVNQLKKISGETINQSVKEKIKDGIIRLEKRIERYDLFLGQTIYELTFDF